MAHSQSNNLPGRTIEEISAEIRVHAQNMAMSYIVIGRDLIEAKQLLGHARFLPWLKEMGFGVSAAEKHMRLAAEVDADSPLASLPYSKALALLRLPAGEREAFAAENDADNKSAAEIRRLIAERDREKDRVSILEAQNKSLLRDWEKEHQAAEKLRADPPVQKVIEVPDDYQQLKAEAARHEREMAEAVQAAEEAERRAADAEAEAARLRREADGAPEDTFSQVLAAANAFLLKVQLLPYNRAELSGMYNRQRYSPIVEQVEDWVREMREAMDGTLDADGAVI